MLLVIDAGNSNVTFGVYDGPALRAHWRIRTEMGRTTDEYAAFLGALFTQSGLALAQVTGVALASVVPSATPALKRLAQAAFGLEALEITAAGNLGLEVAYSPPTDVGTDRLVDAAAAVHKYGAPCIVLDFGSATTFNAVAAPSAPGGLLSVVTAPSATILITDNAPADADTGDISNGTGAVNNPASLSHGRHEINWQLGSRQPHSLSIDGRSQDGYPRHNGGFVLVMADGHAKWRGRTLVSGLYSGGTQDSEWIAVQP